MHYKTKEKYQNLLISGLTQDELKTQMEKDQVSAEEIAAFFDVLNSNTQELIKENQPPAPIQTKTENNTTNIAPLIVSKPEFDYKNLTGESFTKYEEFVNSLPLFDMVDFEVFKVTSVITELYPGLKDSPKNMTGITIVNDKPLHTTRIAPHTAKEMNSHVRNTGRYYLLKK